MLVSLAAQTAYGPRQVNLLINLKKIVRKKNSKKIKNKYKNKNNITEFINYSFDE